MILTYTSFAFDTLTTVTVTTSLSSPVYYHWYRDGAHVGTTIDDPSYTFCVLPGEQAHIECVDTNDADYDPVAGAPSDEAPATRTLFWCRSLGTDVDHYRVEQQADGGDWTLLATIPHDDTQWSYQYQTPRLTDLTAYAWRVVPVDQSGNQGTALALDAEDVVRTPDAPAFAATWDDGTQLVTFSE